MIAKHVPMKSLGKSDFAALVNYLTDPQNKEHRLGMVTISNCASTTTASAISEILATQFMNTRARGDKTFHLILSFREGEQPDPATLGAIEQKICEGLGFEDHQRISVVHNDTDNLHVHLAINKIHPVKGNILEPYYSHLKLARLCEQMEQQYQLQIDNHVPRQTSAAGRASDMERHSGIESLIGWIKRGCLPDLLAASDWPALHQTLSTNGLAMKLRGNGLILMTTNGLVVKASSVHRGLSKPSLEKRFGSFIPAQEVQVDIRTCRHYTQGPLPLKVETSALYACYLRSKSLAREQKTLLQERARQVRDHQLQQAKRAASLRRSAIRFMTDGRLTKTILYAQARSAYRQKVKAIRDNYKHDKAQTSGLYKQHTWADWLRMQAQKGDQEALLALRAREHAQCFKGNCFTGQQAKKAERSKPIDSISKKGNLVFSGGALGVRDNGLQIQIQDSASNEALIFGLHLAIERFGKNLRVYGSEQFKHRVVQAAKVAQIEWGPANPELARLAKRIVQSSASGQKGLVQKSGASKR